MALHWEREAQKERQAREAAGESFWSKEFPSEVRTKLMFAFQDVLESQAHYEVIIARTHRLLCVSLGATYLVFDGTVPVQDDFEACLRDCRSSMMPSVIEAWWLATCDVLVDLQRGNQISRQDATGRAKVLAARIADILESARISFELSGGEMHPFESRELHVEIVEPVLSLLRADSRLADVETAYRKALKEIHDDPSDAITDAGTALQVMLEELGCSGNQLGKLTADARAKGLLAPHDNELAEGIAKIMKWVGADRSESGDGHHVTAATAEDAWLAVHVVGALILRLSGAPRVSG